MATQVQCLRDDSEIMVDLRPQPMLTLVHDASNYDDLEHAALGVASRGIHHGVLGGLVGIYAAMLSSFWSFFARDPQAAFVMAAVTVLMTLYFSLLVGGIALADAPVPGEQQRDFAEFLRGPVDILTGVITGREAVMQMLFLPACMLVLANVVGGIARVSQGG